MPCKTRILCFFATDTSIFCEVCRNKLMMLLFKSGKKLKLQGLGEKKKRRKYYITLDLSSNIYIFALKLISAKLFLLNI